MDQSRTCGVAALASVILVVVAGLASRLCAEPPGSGVGEAAIDAPSETTWAIPAPVDRTEQPGPAELADRIAARLAAADSVAATPGTSTSAGSNREVGVLPAPRPAGTRFIDRFDTSNSGEIAASEVSTAGGWWELPEVRVGGLLLVFIGMAVVARRWSNTRGPRAGRPSGVLSVLARYPFGRGASLVLLEVGPRIVLVHQPGGRGAELRPVAEFTSPEDIAELRTRLGIARRASEPGFGHDLERSLGLYDRNGRPAGFGGPDGLPLEDVMETVDLTRRRPRRGNRTN
jgi:flagellar biogenesis protein FliO